ncbi:MAG: hypothetical protein FWF97_03610 [Alphaproteobacteria bacterium]|nr:hypothetical protein [Alphaproteobacteria bacterium]
MRKILGFLGFAAIAVCFSFVAPNADAAQAQNSRGAGVMTTQARMPSMPGGIGGVIGGNLGANQTWPNIPTSGPNSCEDGACLGCLPGSTRPCTTADGKPGTQTCLGNRTWGPCTANGGGDEEEEKKPTYTVDDCMDALLACVNGGGLPHGINDLFNSDLRHSIMNGMSLCQTVVDYCVANIDIYNGSSDVWIDFNSRVIQPAYYSFVLRKTGLTPFQAENTCLLLDRNTFGKSFAAVGANNSVAGEYQQGISAYNNQGGAKDNPMGVEINTDSNYDGNRGHYARWDATAGECLVRIAAYNKDQLISNSMWFFTTIGNQEQKAEIWQPAGSNFTCNKDLFEFGLMRQTRSAAAFAIPVGGVAGALLGWGIGAGVDKKQSRQTFCGNDKNLEKLSRDLREGGRLGVLNEYLDTPIPASGPVITKPQCQAVIDLYNKFEDVKNLVQGMRDLNQYCDAGRSTLGNFIGFCASAGDAQLCGAFMQKVAQAYADMYAANSSVPYNELLKETLKMAQQLARNTEYAGKVEPALKAFEEFVMANENDASRADQCPSFKSLNIVMKGGGERDFFCVSPNRDCVGPETFQREVDRLGTALGYVEVQPEKKGMSNAGKGALIGAATGLAVGGLATAITAFVEKNNINCRIGDDLDRVAFNKSGNIDSLKNFYVKWALNLPDTIMPTAMVTDCAGWRNACGTLKDIRQCAEASINLKLGTATTPKLIANACTPSGSICIENSKLSEYRRNCQRAITDKEDDVTGR